MNGPREVICIHSLGWVNPNELPTCWAVCGMTHSYHSFKGPTHHQRTVLKSPLEFYKINWADVMNLRELMIEVNAGGLYWLTPCTKRPPWRNRARQAGSHPHGACRQWDRKNMLLVTPQPHLESRTPEEMLSAAECHSTATLEESPNR